MFERKHDKICYLSKYGILWLHDDNNNVPFHLFFSVNIIILFFFMQSCINTIFSVSVSLLIDICINSEPILCIVNIMVSMHLQVSLWYASLNTLGIYPEVLKMCYMKLVDLVFWEICIVISRVAAQDFIPTTRTQASLSLHNLTAFVFLMMIMLTGLRWNFNFVFLMGKDVDYFSSISYTLIYIWFSEKLGVQLVTVLSSLLCSNFLIL